MSFSRLAQSIAESPTLRLNEEARLLRERGEAVVHLGIGEPKNKAPRTAVEKSSAALRRGDVKYSPTSGIPSLKRAIVRYTEDNYEVTVSSNNVLVTAGAKQAIFNALYSIIDPQDEVIILAPYWVSYPEMIKMVRAVPVTVAAGNGGFSPTIEEIVQAVSSRTKAVIINNPNNPSGVLYSSQFIASIVEYCEREDIYLIMDDIYHKLVFDGRRADSCFKHTNKPIEDTNMVVVNGVSKSYGMTGFRIGWAVANSRLVRIMSHVLAQTTSCTSVILQEGAEGALSGIQSTVESLCTEIEGKRDIMMRELAGLPGVEVIKPDATFYCLPNFRTYDGDSVALSEFLLKKAFVVTVPGKAFGMEGFLRLSFAGSEQDITEGIARLRWVLDPESPNEIYIGDKPFIRDWQ